MQTNDHIIRDYDLVLDAEFGKPGTPERARATEAAYSFYTGQILHTARKEAGLTQTELAQKINTKFGALAQLVARYIRIVEVTGSNPVCSTTNPAFRCRIFCFTPLFLQVFFAKTATL